MILVYSTEKKMRHSQDIFRLFLGIADITIGLIVLPVRVISMLKTYYHTLQLQTPINIIGQKQFISTNASYNYINTNTTLTINMLETTMMINKKLHSLVYKNTFGFFTNTSVIVSMYLLTVSGIDRLQALLKPLHYNQDVAKRFAISSAIVCWILAIFVSVLPIFVNSLFYGITAGGSAISVGTIAYTWYLIEIIIPLVVTWIISVSTHLISRKAFDLEKQIANDQNKVKKQRKLNFILFLMVFSFSFSLLPAVLVVLLRFFIPGIDPQSPQTFNPTNNNIAKSLELSVTIIVLSNSLWNFVIYNLRIKTFCKVALEKYKKIWNLINCRKSVLTWKREQEL